MIIYNNTIRKCTFHFFYNNYFLCVAKGLRRPSALYWPAATGPHPICCHSQGLQTMIGQEVTYKSTIHGSNTLDQDNDLLFINIEKPHADISTQDSQQQTNIVLDEKRHEK